MPPVRPSLFAPFGVKSFRFQWPADLLASWAFEMEILILGWYVLVKSESVLLLVAFGALQYVGSLISPAFGVAGDRIGYRKLFMVTRAVYAMLAITLAVFAVNDALTPLTVLIIAGISGMIKPSDIMMRFALISQTLPATQMIGALGLSRVTTDSARIAGALAGVGVFAAFGLVPAYVVVTLLYAMSFLLAMGVSPGKKNLMTVLNVPACEDVSTAATSSSLAAPPASLFQDLCAVFRYVWAKPELLGAFSLAFLVNIMAYPLFLGLLPFVAKNIYNVGQAGLGLMGASYAFGSLVGSLAVSMNRFSMGPARLMLIAAVCWFVVDLVFAQVTQMAVGLVLLTSAGLCQSICLTPLAGVMLKCADPAYRGRVMGMRMLAIWGLPTGLMLSGSLINFMGFGATASVYSVIGLSLTLLIGFRWRHQLWSVAAPVNQNLAVSSAT
jgi:predicted MFS family arabinose efflux permease